MKPFKILAAVVTVCVAVFVGGCSDEAPSGLPQSGLGGNSVIKYVAIGNSLTAGYQSGALYEDAQLYSFPNIIAQQLTKAGASLGKFEQPIWGNPGSPDAAGKAARYELISLDGPVIGPRGVAAGTPTNTALARPYDNLGIPGAVVYDFLDTTEFIAKAAARQNPFFPHVLRSAPFGKSIFEQLKNMSPKPDIVTFWLGNNDVLGFATSGGVNPNAPTSTAVFGALYAQALDSLRAALPNAKIVVANIPDVRAIPYFTTVGPAVAADLKGTFAVSYQKHGTTGPGDGSSYLTEQNPPLLILPSSSYVTQIGTATGKYYSSNNKSVPAGIDTTAMFGLNYLNPIPDALILDSAEQATAANAIAAYNQTIAQVAAAKNAAVVDINAIFNSIKKNGYNISGEMYTADYVSGGLFSLDGVHPSSRGAGIVANEFIKVMNAKFGMSIPYVDVTTLPGIPAPLAKYAESKFRPRLNSAAAKHIQDIWK
ncbi:MAG: SGNH/GDSL hydrolase family protein [Bacteroidota bacterium]